MRSTESVLVDTSTAFVSSVFRREDFLRVNGYNVKLSLLEDWEFYIRLLCVKSRVVKIDKIMFFYRQSSDNTGIKYSTEDWAQAYDRVILLHLRKYFRYHFLTWFRYFVHFRIVDPIRNKVLEICGTSRKNPDE